MSESPLFQHQNYWRVPAPESFELVVPQGFAASGSVANREQLARAGRSLKAAGVHRVMLVHGTLAGTDAMGWYGSWGRYLPGISRRLKRAYKDVVDRLAEDRGNFTDEYAQLLETGLNSDEKSEIGSEISVERFAWSSENHHLGRADAAVRLALRLLDHRDAEERVLLIGHSHGGNVFALVTNLVGATAHAQPGRIESFFNAIGSFSQSTHRIDIDAWRHLRSRLETQWDARRPVAGESTGCDFVTLGTPIRYGWDPTGYDRLLNFVNHHRGEGRLDYQSIFPGTHHQMLDLLQGDYGDLVQQVFVAGTDFPPAIWSLSAWRANRGLRRLLETSTVQGRLMDQLKQALRVSASGTTLLIDYAQADASAKVACGHAVYTDLDWMAYHVDEIATRFYR